MQIFTNEMLYNDNQFDAVHAYVHSKEIIMNLLWRMRIKEQNLIFRSKYKQILRINV